MSATFIGFLPSLVLLSHSKQSMSDKNCNKAQEIFFQQSNISGGQTQWITRGEIFIVPDRMKIMLPCAAEGNCCSGDYVEINTWKILKAYRQ